MEDPWANAWGETSKSVLPEPSPTWAAPSVSVLHGDNEDDLSTRSWTNEPATHWGATDLQDNSIWGGNPTISSAWVPEPSTFDQISLGGDSQPDLTSSFPESTEEVDDFDDFQTPSHSPSLEKAQSLPPSPPAVQPRSSSPPPTIPAPISIPPPEDPDGFGSFETGISEDTPGWTPSKANFEAIPSADAAAWGSAWEEPTSAAADTRNDADDEWETARQQKEALDRHVPPELLASILQQLEELSPSLWGETEVPSGSQFEDVRHTDFGSLGLELAQQKLIPEDLMLPPYVPFSKTYSSKQLAEALKLTRNFALTKASPIAMYMSSKGSTAWEASVKARPNIASDDVTPAGWKILETPKEAPSNDDGKKKAGGIFSYFSRRATSTAAESSPMRSSSPVSTSGGPSIRSGTSPRPSVDSSRSSVAQSQVLGRSRPASPVPAIGVSEKATLSRKESTTQVLSPTSEALVGDGVSAEITPPSTVSRFLGRFAGRHQRTASKDSLALSNDDLEFLSDVPTVSSNETDQGSDMDALSRMLQAPPLRTTTLPAPLPRPPSKPVHAPRLAPPPSNRSFSSSPAPSEPDDDFMSFFDSSDAKPSSSTNTPKMKPLASTPFPGLTPSSVPTPPRQTTPSYTANRPSIDLGAEDDSLSWASFDYPTAPATKPAPTAPQAKRSFVPIMSSSRPPSSTPSPSSSKPPTPFALPPPPSFPLNRTVSNGAPSVCSSSFIPPLAAPPGSRPQPLPQFDSSSISKPSAPGPALVQAPSAIDDEDDFADFLSSPPAQNSQPAPFNFEDFAAPSIPGPPPSAVQTMNMSSNGGLVTFEGFTGFFPPPPPAKSGLGRKVSLGSSGLNAKAAASSRPPANHVRKISRQADHARTQSLLESAAARGRWLAPPSPIPEALSPPPDGSAARSSVMDIFEGESKMQAQQSRAAASLAPPPPASYPVLGPNLGLPLPSTGNSNGNEKPHTQSQSSSWLLPPPPSKNASSIQPPPTMANQTKLAPPLANFLQPAPTIVPKKPSSTKVGAGGLSAQDLSFFEGL